MKIFIVQDSVQLLNETLTLKKNIYTYFVQVNIIEGDVLVERASYCNTNK